MGLKGRSVSPQSPFSNNPYTLNMSPEKILEKPGRINIESVAKDPKPHAGLFTQIGLEMLRVGVKNAPRIVMGPWHDKPVMHSTVDYLPIDP